MLEAIIVASLVGLTELISRVRKQEWNAVVTIVVAMVAGGVAGLLGIAELGSIAEGIAAGLSAVGVHTTARQVGS